MPLEPCSSYEMALRAHLHHGSVISGMVVFALSHMCPLCWTTSMEKARSSHHSILILIGQKVCLECKGYQSVQITKNREVNLMASQKHLDLLSSGKIGWNTWRRAFPDVQALEPDLHGADLYGADLHGADLHGADLSEANLQGANLRGADLREADLRSANLNSANLSEANLLKARLHWADLRGANLCRTNLKEADLSKADLRGADLDGAILGKAKFDEANFSGVDLSGADLNGADLNKADVSGPVGTETRERIVSHALL